MADEITEAGNEAIANYSSVADRSSAGEIIDVASAAFGRIDVLVNNAGIARQNMLWDMPEHDFDAILATHLNGAWNCTNVAAPHFIEQRSGCILNVSSTVAVIGAVANTGYAAAKASVIGLTFGAALDLGPFGIRVNVIFPAAHSRLDDKPEPWREKYNTHPRPMMDPARWPLDAVPPLFIYLASVRRTMSMGSCSPAGRTRFSWYPLWMPTREIISADGSFTYEELAARVPDELLVDAKNPSPAQGEDRVWQSTRLDALPPAHNPEQPADGAAGP